MYALLTGPATLTTRPIPCASTFGNVDLGIKLTWERAPLCVSPAHAQTARSVLNSAVHRRGKFAGFEDSAARRHRCLAAMRKAWAQSRNSSLVRSIVGIGKM